jgi:hypothetical protein
VPFLIGLQLAFAALVAGVALAPTGADSMGSWVLLFCLIGARLVLSGVIVVRSLVWTLNYPREVRGRITARLGLLQTLTMAATALAGSAMLDANPESFRLIYAGGAVLSLGGIWAFSHVRLVGEKRQLVRERRAAAPREREAELGFIGVLRDDPNFARYQAWQFCLGTSNMLIEGPLVYLISRELQASYLTSIALTIVIPFALAVMTIPVWGNYLDRRHIVEFRARHSWWFAASQLALWYGALTGSLLWVGVSRVILGLARGGGMIAWQLGHNDFADAERVGVYMGIHVTLTGMRGVFAPLLGMLLYVGWSPLLLPGTGIQIPGFAGIGSDLMLGSCLLAAVAGLGYVRLQRRIARD